MRGVAWGAWIGLLIFVPMMVVADEGKAEGDESAGQEGAPALALAITPEGTGTVANFGARGDSNLQVLSGGRTISFVVDFGDNNSDVLSHVFSWYRNDFALSSRMMTMSAADGIDDGTLRLADTLVEDAFDLAESFWVSEPIEPGTVLAIDPERAGGATPTQGAYDRLLLGVASTRPGLLMGGFAFSVQQLERAWGPEAAALFEAERPVLEAEVYAAAPELRAERERVAGLSGQGRADASRELETEVFDRTMELFFERHTTPVALAGRVPVRVDASYGAIVAGDDLTASPVPGVAMKATGSGTVLGVALEGLAEGSGTVLALIDRGWRRGR